MSIPILVVTLDGLFAPKEQTVAVPSILDDCLFCPTAAPALLSPTSRPEWITSIVHVPMELWRRRLLNWHWVQVVENGLWTRYSWIKSLGEILVIESLTSRTPASVIEFDEAKEQLKCLARDWPIRHAPRQSWDDIVFCVSSVREHMNLSLRLRARQIEAPILAEKDSALERKQSGA